MWMPGPKRPWPWSRPAPQSAPFLIPLIPSSITDSEEIAVGCLAKDFLPNSLILSWQKPNNESLEAAKIRQFPSIFNSVGAFTASSEATIPARQWQAFEPFYCKAELASETRVARLVHQTPIACLPPEITIRVPPLDDFRGAFLNATILCKADHLHTRHTAIKWLKDGKVLTSGFTTTTSTRRGRDGYTIISELTVTKKDWFAEKIFSCQVQNEKINETRNVSKPSACEGCDCNVPIHVETIPPPFSDIYLTKSARLTCRISNIPYSQDLAELNVTWTRASDNKPLETVIGQAKEQENREMLFVDATVTLCPDEWENGSTYKCKVTLPLMAKAEVKSLKKQNGGSRRAPSVYVLPPPPEQLALKGIATVTCLLKSFYPSDFFVKWLQNGEPVGVSEYYTSNPIQDSRTPKRYFSYSMLNVDEQDWSSGVTYTCVVGHEAFPVQTIQKTIDKDTAYLDWTVFIDEDEGLLNISSTLSTFIVLFLVSLFYSGAVTVIKTTGVADRSTGRLTQRSPSIANRMSHSSSII